MYLTIMANCPNDKVWYYALQVLPDHLNIQIFSSVTESAMNILIVQVINSQLTSNY